MTDERQELARQFVRTLDQLHRAWELHYVPAGRVPGGSAGAGAATTESGPQPPAAAKIDVDEKQALRSQASGWGPATKLEYLRVKNIGQCTRCPLSKTRTNIVFGVGDPEAKIMFVGEAPGADEDRQGEPFVGRAGQRLTQWIEALQLSREQVYIANVLKCRPPANRDPRPDEVAKCSPFLQAQIRAIGPAVIVALGRHAGQLLSRRDELTLHAMRSSRLTYDAGESADGASLRIPLLVTYHPAWVLRQEGGERGGDPDAIVMGDLRSALSIAYPDRDS